MTVIIRSVILEAPVIIVSIGILANSNCNDSTNSYSSNRT